MRNLDEAARSAADYMDAMADTIEQVYRNEALTSSLRAEAVTLRRTARLDDVWILTDRDGEEWVEMSAFADHEAALRRFREILAVDTSYAGAVTGPYDEGSDARLIFAAAGARILMLHNPRLT